MRHNKNIHDIIVDNDIDGDYDDEENDGYNEPNDLLEDSDPYEEDTYD